MPGSLTPSQRPHGAQRILASTTLVVEALVMVFAALVAHQLSPGTRAPVWTLALVTAVLLVLTSGMLKKRAWPYAMGALLQLPLVAMGIWVGAMWAVGLLFAAIYVYSVLIGRKLDAEKDAVDASYWEAHPEEDPRRADPGLQGRAR